MVINTQVIIQVIFRKISHQKINQNIKAIIIFVLNILNVRFYGGGKGNRTLDPLRAKQMLYP